MAASYPLTIPAEMVPAKCKLWLQRRIYTQENAGQGMISVDAGPAVWMMEFTTVDLDDYGYGIAKSFLDQLEEGIGSFLGYDVARSVPWAYQAGRNTPPGSYTGNIFSVAGNNVDVTFHSLPANYRITAGDFFAYEWTVGSVTYRALHRFVQSVVANGSGTATAEVRPAIRDSSIGATPNIILAPPAGFFRLVPQSVDWGEEQARAFTPISFHAQNVLWLG
jgi:hypothetical protein